MQLHLSTVVGCLVRCCCVPFLLCFFFFFYLAVCCRDLPLAFWCCVSCFSFAVRFFRLLVGLGVYVLLYFFLCFWLFFREDSAGF